MKLSISLVALVLLVGVGITIADWHKWREAELAKYGHGKSADATDPAAALDRPYQWDDHKLRISPPSGWNRDIVDDRLIFTSDLDRIEVWGQASSEVLATAVDNRVSELPPLVSERQYTNSPNASLTILTWQEGDQTRQLAMARGREELITIAASSPTSSWPSQVSTFWAVYQSLVLF